MLEQNVIGKLTHTIPREDGSAVKIVVTDVTSPWDLQQQIDTYVLHRASSNSDWTVLNDRPHPDARQMSVEQYVKFGRPPLLERLTRHEQLVILPTLKNALGKPMAFMSTLNRSLTNVMAA